MHYILYILGLCAEFVGALFKIMHYSGGNELLMTATFLKVIGGLLLLYKLLSNPKIREFLDW